MQHSPFRRAKRAAALAGILTLGLATTPAFADDLQATDEGGDVLTNMGSSQKVLDFGIVCAGSTTTHDVTLAVIRGNVSDANEYKDGAVIDLSSTVDENDAVHDADDAVLSPGAAADITLPGDWNAQEDGTSSPTSTSVVSFVAGSDLGSYTAELRYDAVGTNNHQNANDLRKFTKFTVTANVQHCEEGRGAPAIANEHLRDRGDNSDCKDNLGTNKNKSNWHGQLISAVAHEFEGTTFTEEDVHEFVEDACQNGLP